MIAAARAANAIFFIVVSAYCFLSASPFAFEQFIKPSVLPALTDFVRLSPLLFWLMWLIAVQTLMPLLRGRSVAAWSFIVTMAVAGAAIAAWQPLGAIGSGRAALVAGVLAIVPLLWLSIVDHLTIPAPRLQSSGPSRALVACAASAVVIWGMYAAAVPFRAGQVLGVDLGPGALVRSLAAGLLAQLTMFAAVFLSLLSVMRLAALTRRAALAEYWAYVAMLAAGATLVAYFLVCRALEFTGGDGVIAAFTLGIAVAAGWADIARTRAQKATHAVDALGVFFGAVAGTRRKASGALVLAVLPFVAYGLAAAVRQWDWDFLLQKLGVIGVAIAALAACYAVVPARRRYSDLWLAVGPIAVLLIAVAVPTLSLEAAPSGYEAVDPAFRLLRDAHAVRSAETAEYYAYLRAHTLVARERIRPIDADFVRPLGPAPVRPPHVFLLVVDSLRRDYLSPYNPGVTFTPEIAKFAADSDVFERAFTRYAGTFLAVQSLWAGGLVLHATAQPAFDRLDTLRKLLRANRYVTMMTRDNVVSDFVPEDADVVPLGRGRGQMDIRACATFEELENRLGTRDPGRPVFFWSLPQDVHLGVMTRITVPAGENHPGFFDKVASQVRQLDGCFGRFIESLKRANLYDDSIVILTADHGDLYGVEGRWGHANVLYPDVMRVPLIVRVPPRLRGRLRADLSEVAFLSDLTPTLYQLLGQAPANLGPLYGRPLFVDAAAATSSRREQNFLVASSYGAVYGIVSHNGRRLSVVDTIEGREYVADMSGTAPVILQLTGESRAFTRSAIRQHIQALAALYHFVP